MFIIIIDALELNHIHLHRRGAGKERKTEIGLNGKSREVMTYTVKLYYFMFILVKLSPFWAFCGVFVF